MESCKAEDTLTALANGKTISVNSAESSRQSARPCLSVWDETIVFPGTLRLRIKAIEMDSLRSIVNLGILLEV